MTALTVMATESSGLDLKAMSTDDLKGALLECLRITARALRDAAFIVHELEERGEDLDALKMSWMKWLRLIAHGQVSADAVARFAGKVTLLDAVGGLPLPDQDRLAGGEPVRLLVYTTDGKPTHRMADPRDLTPDQIRQVFDKRCIRNEAAQALYLDDKRQKAARAVPSAVGELKIDRERSGVMHGRKFIPLADLVAAVKALQN